MTLVCLGVPGDGGPALERVAELTRNTVRDTDAMWQDGERGLALLLADARRADLRAGARPAEAAAAGPGPGDGHDGACRAAAGGSARRSCCCWRGPTARPVGGR